jgi:hypothetical protein
MFRTGAGTATNNFNPELKPGTYLTNACKNSVYGAATLVFRLFMLRYGIKFPGKNGTVPTYVASEALLRFDACPFLLIPHLGRYL